MSKIVWLASYPKSGNTWLRAFLTNFLANGDQPASINALNVGRNASRRDLFDEALGLESSDMIPAEIECNRPAAFRSMAARNTGNFFLKIHDAYSSTAAGEPLIPADVTRGAIYLVRNPLDLAISAAHHSGRTIDEVIACMADETFVVPRDRGQLHLELSQRLLSWSSHVLSWIDQRVVPVHLMRYEDICARPAEAFGAALEFLDLHYDNNRLQRAIEFSAFPVLRQQELADGFRERPHAAVAFFRQGQTGEWRRLLTESQAERIVADHRAVMRRLGYSSETGCAV